MYRPFLEIKNGTIVENYVTSTASKELVDTIYKAIRVFALSKHSKVEVTRNKLNIIVNAVLNNEKHAIEFGGDRYNINDVIYAYIKTHSTMNLDINMIALNTFYDNEIKPLIKYGCDDKTIATLFAEFIIMNNFPNYLLMSVLDKDAFLKMQYTILPLVNVVLIQIMEQVKEERN